MSVFRVRPTDDSYPTWCVADGKYYDDTEHYIDRFGEVVDRCIIFSTEKAAIKAHNKYQRKQELKLMNELQTRLEQCRKAKAAIEAEEKKLLAKIEQKQTQQQDVPIISWGTFDEPRDRVIINLTPNMIQAIQHYDAKQIVVYSDGRVGNSRQDHKVSCMYRNVTPIFGSFVPEED